MALSRPVVFMFSGKGSQYYNMGFDLYMGNDRFRYHVDRLDSLCQKATGKSVKRALFSMEYSPGRPIYDPLLSVLSIFLIECALAKALIESGVVPDEIVTASMGIYAGAVTAGALSEEAAFAYLHASCNIFTETCEPGGLSMVLCSQQFYEDANPLSERSSLAAANGDVNIVIAYPKASETGLIAEIERLNLASQKLPISRPYHSHWIEPARERFINLFEAHVGGHIELPMHCISGDYGVSMFCGEAVWRAVRQPMYFRRKIELLERRKNFCYIDVGPGSTSATLLKYCLPANSNSTFFPVLSQFGGDCARFEAVVARQ